MPNNYARQYVFHRSRQQRVVPCVPCPVQSYHLLIAQERFGLLSKIGEPGLFPLGFVFSSVHLKHAVFCNGHLKVSKRYVFI